MYNLRPSASGIWTKCAANPRISANVKREPVTSDAAREGTCAAWVAECVLKGKFAACVDMVDQVHENGWVVDSEMAYHIQGYVDMVRSRGGVINAEMFVRLSETIAGTYDSSVVVYDSATLFGDDLKYGFGIVDVYECTQLIIYLYGEYLRLGRPAHIQRVTLGIYQPRAYHPEGIHRTWTISIQELYERALAIVQAGDKCQDPEAVATPGAHCTYCKGATECASSAWTLYKGFEVIERCEQGAMSAEELANEANFLKLMETMLKGRKAAVDAELEARLSADEYVRGWGLEDRTGNRKFTVDPVTVHLLTGVNPFKQEVMSPAELEKAGANKAIVKTITRVPKIGTKLKQTTDKDFGRMLRER
ncbi:CRISPR/Cas system-associated protein [Rhizobium phage RHph_Y5A]|nr:CRISPR/Cas system-associated protein [Rhizobium phage RHph_Y5A]QIG75449.1 CRISPR/Cas system-associated protein [Rhizobium phage RHph_Y2_4]